MSIRRISFLGLGGIFFAASLAVAQTFKSDGSAVTLTLSNGVSAVVPFPQARAWSDSVQAWTLGGVEFSPVSTSAVVLFRWSVPKYSDGAAYLVKPNGAVLSLKNSGVWKTLWTRDGKYILGFGDNTLRLWNLKGALRQLSFSEINDFSFSGKSICLDVNVRPYKNGEYSNAEYIQFYSLPMLKKIRSVPALEGTYCEHQP